MPTRLFVFVDVMDITYVFLSDNDNIKKDDSSTKGYNSTSILFLPKLGMWMETNAYYVHILFSDVNSHGKV